MAKLDANKIRKIFAESSGDKPKQATQLAAECGVSNSRVWEVLHNVSVSPNLIDPKEYHALLKQFHGDKYDEIVAKGQSIMDKRKAKAKERAAKLKALAEAEAAKNKGS